MLINNNSSPELLCSKMISMVGMEVDIYEQKGLTMKKMKAREISPRIAPSDALLLFIIKTSVIC
jgi:hypothetical protein